MINQREKHVTFGTAFGDYFRGFVDFTGYSTRAGHWFPFGTIYGAVILIFIIFFGSLFSSIVGIGSRASNSYYYASRSAGLDLLNTASNAFVFLIIFCVILFVLAIPTTASFARRLRDVGFAVWGIVLTIVLFYILNIFTIYILTLLYDICFIFVLMSLPTNCLETDKNDDFSKFLFRQTQRAEQYFGQFNNSYGQTYYNGQNNGQYNQYGQPNFQGGQQFNQNQQGYNGYQNQQNQNSQRNNANQGYNNQNQGYPQYDQYGNLINPYFQGNQNGMGSQNSNFQGNQNNGINQNEPKSQQPMNQGYPNQGYNPNGPRPQQQVNQGYPNQGYNPNGPRLQQQVNQGHLNHGVNPNYGQNPNGPRQQQVNQGHPNQGYNPNGPRPQQPKNQGPINQGVNPNQQVQSPVKETPKPQETVQKQEVPTPEVKATPEVKETVEVRKEVSGTPSIQGGAKSRRLQKLNKPEEEQTILKRRNK